LLLALLAIAASAAFLTVGARGDLGFVVPFRSVKLAGMVLVAISVAVSTVVFQTVTRNRLLTPSVLGFDALYIALQTALVFGLGAGGAAMLDGQLRFVLLVLLMLSVASVLFEVLLARTVGDLHLPLLAGVVFGLFCRSLVGLMQRMLDPNDFAALAITTFARFNAIEPGLLPLAAVAVVAVLPAVWRLATALDVMALGRDASISLGVDHDRLQRWAVALAAILVCVSTALVGPVLFLGILVSHLAYRLIGSERHRHNLPGAALIAVIVLAGGQTVVERLLGLDVPLGVVVDFLGGSRPGRPSHNNAQPSMGRHVLREAQKANLPSPFGSMQDTTSAAPCGCPFAAGRGGKARRGSRSASTTSEWRGTVLRACKGTAMRSKSGAEVSNIQPPSACSSVRLEPRRAGTANVRFPNLSQRLLLARVPRWNHGADTGEGDHEIGDRSVLLTCLACRRF